MKINGLNFKIGADPEFFVKRHSKLVSAYGLIPGTKDDPHKVPRGAVQVDGMALEFNIDPASDYQSFERNMTTVMDAIFKMVPGYEMFVEPVADFGMEYILEQPEDARNLGCSPDYNAYTGRPNPRPDVNTPFRTASGHVHIGWHDEPVSVEDEGHLEACRALTKALDVYLGAPSVVWDDDDRRRTLYGAAGAFRPKPYGMEYRVLSNKWITDPNLRKFVYGNTIEAIKATFANVDVGESAYFGLTAKDILAKKEGWEDSLHFMHKYGGIKFPRDYRQAS